MTLIGPITTPPYFGVASVSHCSADKFRPYFVWTLFTFNRVSPSLFTLFLLLYSNIAPSYRTSLLPHSPLILISLGSLSASGNLDQASRSSRSSTDLRSALGGLSEALVEFGPTCETRHDLWASCLFDFASCSCISLLLFCSEDSIKTASIDSFFSFGQSSICGELLRLPATDVVSLTLHLILEAIHPFA